MLRRGLSLFKETKVVKKPPKKTKREIKLEANKMDEAFTLDLVGQELSVLFKNVQIPPVQKLEFEESADVLLKELFPKMKPSKHFKDLKEEILPLEKDVFLDSYLSDEDITEDLRRELEEEDVKEINKYYSK